MLLRNTEKLQQLIDQLLELSQLEAETIPLNKQNLDIVSLVKGLTYSFIPLAEQKTIKLEFNCSIKELPALIDKDKIEKIINNLLSNAFKFTPAGGNIDVDLVLSENTEKNIVMITIRDTGPGIPEEYQAKIFNRFYQVEDSNNTNFSGSGIGLALVKELVTLQKWDISVQSKEGEGAGFTLEIPLEEGSDTECKEPVTSTISTEPGTDNIALYSSGKNLNDTGTKENETNQKPVILFVDDSQDLRIYVSDLLKTDYKVLLAENGKSGIVIALNSIPDLIISDIMMPEMDGIEFCNQIKADWQTCHIPVILLTARATADSKIEGLETGADDYLTKPFNYDELSVRIKNLIEQRKRLREKFSKDININPELLTGNSTGNDFMKKVINIAENNLNDSGFNSEILAKELFVSRRQLHRKLLAVAGQGPGEFIRILRLKKAARMLIENKFSVTQIAMEVGFESPAQFTRAFKKHFNCLPSEFGEKYPGNQSNPV